MNVNLYMQYLYDIRGDEKLINKVLRENGGIPQQTFALDEFCVRLTEEKVKKYIPEFTINSYVEWFRKRNHEHWKDVHIKAMLFD